MFFDIKMEARRVLHQSRIALTVASFADRTASLIPIAGIGAVLYLMKSGFEAAATVYFCAAVFLPLLLISVLLRVSAVALLNKSWGKSDQYPTPLFRRIVDFICSQVRIVLKRIGWTMLFLAPAAIPVAVVVFLSEEMILFPEGAFIAVITSAVLFIIGIMSNITVTAVYDMDRFFSASGLSVEEINSLIHSAQRKRYALFRLSLIGWRIASAIPLLSLFAVPFVSISKAVYFDSLRNNDALMKIYSIKR